MVCEWTEYMMKLAKVLLVCLFAASWPVCAFAQFAAQQTWGATSTGSANAQVVSIPNVSSLADLIGVPIRFVAGFTNTGSTTAAIGGLAPIAIKSPSPTGPIALVGGEIQAGNPQELIYDGTTLYMTVFRGSLPGTPTPLLAPRSYYVTATGSDANTCLIGFPCATIQHVINVAQTLNMNGYNVTVNVGPGTYAPFVGGPLNGSGFIIIVGDIVTPTNVLVSAASGEAVYIQSPGYILEGLELASASNGAAPHTGAGLRTGATVQLKNMAFSTCASAHLWTDPSGYIVFSGALNGAPSDFYWIVGAAPSHMFIGSGVVNLGLTNLTVTGTPAFSNFAVATNLGQILGPYNSVTGTATGAKCLATLNSIISGTSTFPGNTGCSTLTGGQFN